MLIDLDSTPNLDLYKSIEFSDVKTGGRWGPTDCREPVTVVVIIPFHDPHGERERNLKFLIMQLHYILQRHMLKYIIVVSQQVLHIIS